MRIKPLSMALLGLLVGTGHAVAAAPDWSQLPSTEVVLYYPGVSPIEWMKRGVDHGGARGMSKGERCLDCHSEEGAEMGQKVVTGQKIEPTPISGKVGSIPVQVQAAHDGENLYLRFSWKQPAGGAPKQDEANQVKLAFMLDDGRVAGADLSGCWESCHGDARTMPDADETRTKYVAGGGLDKGVFYDLMQWTSSGEFRDGHVGERRVMDSGASLQQATGEQQGDRWTVTFVRSLAAAGPGDIDLVSGNSYNFGFAIHDDHSHGRFHHVSNDYQLGIDAEGEIRADRQ
jgi:hypothetical protein